MPAWAPGSWAADAWVGTAWDESTPAVGTAWFSTAWAANAWGSAAWAAGGAAVPVITTITPAATSIDVAWTGSATHYRIDGGTTTALPDGTSPDTITGLTSNTEYNSPGLELSGDGGSTWSDPVTFGTLNPGGGGGGVPTYADFTQADGAATASTLTSRVLIAATVTAADGSATAATFTGKLTARAAFTTAAGAATAATMFSAGDVAAITPADGAATAATIAAKVIARASMTAAAGSATAATITGTTPAAPTVTLRLFATPAGTSVVASATGIEWGWYDDATTLLEALATTPTVTGSGDSADASGYLTLTLTGSVKTSGQRGYLLFSDGTGAEDENPRTFGAMVAVD